LEVYGYNTAEPADLSGARHAGFLGPMFLKGCPANQLLFRETGVGNTVKTLLAPAVAYDMSAISTSLSSTTTWPQIQLQAATEVGPFSTAGTNSYPFTATAPSTHYSTSVPGSTNVRTDSCTTTVTVVDGMRVEADSDCPADIAVTADVGRIDTAVSWTVTGGYTAIFSPGSKFRVGRTVVHQYSSTKFCSFNIDVSLPAQYYSWHGGPGHFYLTASKVLRVDGGRFTMPLDLSTTMTRSDFKTAYGSSLYPIDASYFGAALKRIDSLYLDDLALVGVKGAGTTLQINAYLGSYYQSAVVVHDGQTLAIGDQASGSGVACTGRLFATPDGTVSVVSGKKILFDGYIRINGLLKASGTGSTVTLNGANTLLHLIAPQAAPPTTTIDVLQLASSTSRLYIQSSFANTIYPITGTTATLSSGSIFHSDVPASLVFTNSATALQVSNAELTLDRVAYSSRTPTINWLASQAASASITVTVGDTVRWNWVGEAHSVRSGTPSTPTATFSSGRFGSGTFAYTFNSVGVFPYFDEVTNTITATITVVNDKVWSGNSTVTLGGTLQMDTSVPKVQLGRAAISIANTGLQITSTSAIFSAEAANSVALMNTFNVVGTVTFFTPLTLSTR